MLDTVVPIQRTCTASTIDNLYQARGQQALGFIQAHLPTLERPSTQTEQIQCPSLPSHRGHLIRMSPSLLAVTMSRRLGHLHRPSLSACMAHPQPFSFLPGATMNKPLDRPHQQSPSVGGARYPA